MMIDYGAPAAALIGASTVLLVIATVIVKWIKSNKESRRRIANFARQTAILAVIGMSCVGLFDRTPHGTECRKSASPDGLYVAERCLLDWVPGGSSKYVGRLFDAKSGKLLAQKTFSTSVPEISWLNYEGAIVSFSVGDADDGGADISLPPSRWDRLLAARPRL